MMVIHVWVINIISTALFILTYIYYRKEKSKTSMVLLIGMTLVFSGHLIDTLVGELLRTYEIASPWWHDHLFYANLFASVGYIIATSACFVLVLRQKKT
jgi:multisubunit Na+/H+ antiporter MnhB subunit